MPPERQAPSNTPDGRYIIVRRRLWRAANPHLPEEDRARLVTELMQARRAVGAALKAGDIKAEREARGRVHGAKVALGRARAGLVDGWRSGREPAAGEELQLCGVVGRSKRVIQ